MLFLTVTIFIQLLTAVGKNLHQLITVCIQTFELNFSEVIIEVEKFYPSQTLTRLFLENIRPRLEVCLAYGAISES